MGADVADRLVPNLSPQCVDAMLQNHCQVDSDTTNDKDGDDDNKESRVLMWALTGLALALAIVWVGKKFNDIWDLPLEMILRYPEGPPPS